MPSLCVVTGNLKTLLGGNANFATVSFQLGNIGQGMIPMVLGTGVFPALTVPVYCDESGAFSTNLWGNDNITPGNTIYLLTFRDQNRNEVGQIQYFINGASFNINDATPLNGTFPPVLVQVGNINRFEPVLGTPLVAGDFVLTGWGAGATITAITGTDTAFQITITAGVGPTISPTILLTYHDGPWGNIPMVTPQMVAGTGSVSDVTESATLNTCTLTYDGLPEATKTYTIGVLTMGYSILASSNPQFVPANTTAALVVRLDRAGLTASVAPTVAFTGLSGMYRLISSLITTVVGTGSVNLTAIYNNGAVAETIDGDSLDLATLGAEARNILEFYSGNGQVSYSTTYAATGTYDLHLRLEYLG